MFFGLMLPLCMVVAGQRNNNPDSFNYDDNSYITGIVWLKKHLDDPNLVLLDARNPQEYQQGHIPKAISVAWQDFSNLKGKSSDQGWGTVLPPKDLAKALGGLGITNSSRVIVVADPKSGWGEDGRFVWMLHMAGIRKACLLDGGFTAWKTAGYPISTSFESKPAVSLTIDTFDPTFSADTQWVVSHLNSAKIIDARTQKEYDGAVLFEEARGGHIPGAVLLPFDQVFNGSGRIKSQSELEDLFERAGLSKKDHIVTYCTAGIRSAHLAVVLRMAGFVKTRNYDESFYRWAADETLEVE